MQFAKLPHMNNPSGGIRKAGFEFEFTELDIRDAAKVISSLVSGKISEKNRFEFSVQSAGLGEFKLEYDTALLKDKPYETILRKIGIDLDEFVDRSELEEAIAHIASHLIPIELITPPLPITELDILEDIREQLRSNCAAGTRSSFFYAFAMHINVEAASLEPEYLLKILRSFLLLYPWIRKEADIDFTRRLTPFVDKFPDAYTSLILNDGYRPDANKLIKDYIAFNPTRNRPLDMLPVFAALNKNIIDSLEISAVSARPAFHYRIPNCLINDKTWRVSHEWRYWVEVERLAENTEAREALSRMYIETLYSELFSFEEAWVEQIQNYLGSESAAGSS